jgi:intracellular sulfur oxidation DsrE/DsrF family protein
LKAWQFVHNGAMTQTLRLIALLVSAVFSLNLSAQVLKPMPEIAAEKKQERFPGDPASHKLVYMFNQADLAYQTSVLNSIQAIIKVYGDDASIALVAIGPGIHAFAQKPKRETHKEITDRIENFAKSYGVRFIVCGNTMNTVGYAEADMKPFTEYALVGAAALMRLQEEGFKPIFW